MIAEMTMAERLVWLSPRESQALHCIARGMSNQEIAAAMGIAVSTAARHVSGVRRRLHLHTRRDIAVFALQAGVVRLDDIEV